MTNPFAAPGQAPAQPAFQQPPSAPPAQQFAPQPQQPGGFYQQPQTAQEAAQYQPPAPQPAAPAQNADTGSFFGGAATLSFADPATKGQARGGVVISKEVTQRTNMQSGRPEFWQNGQPKMQLAVVLQTAERADPQDDGKRTLYIKSHMVKAVKTALQQAGVSDLEIGGLLLVAWVDDQPSKTPGFGAAKLFAAQYQRAGQFDPSPYQQGQPGGPRVAPAPAQPVNGAFTPSADQGVAQAQQQAWAAANPVFPAQSQQQPAPAAAAPQAGGFNPFG